MRVLVIANDETKKELLAQPIHESIQLQWIDTPHDNTGLKNLSACIDLLFENDPKRINCLQQLSVPLTVINSVTKPLSEISGDFIRINGWNTFLKRTMTEASCKKEELKNSAVRLFELLGRRIEWTPDIAGFITPRITASIINEAFFTLEEKVCNKQEIDLAMKSGTNYPYGPFEWAGLIGYAKIVELLTILSTEKKRYKPSDLLKQTALQNS